MHVYMHTQEFSEAVKVGSVKSRDLIFLIVSMTFIISLRDHGRRDCWYRQRENQSLWFSWAFSCFLFFSRLILSESLLYFTGEQSRHFLLTKPFPVFKILFSLFISVSWLALFFLSAQVRVFTVWHLVHAFLLRLRTKGKNCSIVYSKRKMSYNLLLVLAVCIQAKWPIRPALISVPCSMKLLGVFLLPPPPGWDGSPSLEGLLEH